MDICTQFGLLVKFYRTQKGMSQEKLAELSELHRTYISDIERGTRSISLRNIEKVANALDVPIYRLFDFEENDNGD